MYVCVFILNNAYYTILYNNPQIYIVMEIRLNNNNYYNLLLK